MLPFPSYFIYSINSTYDWWKDIWIPAIGAIAIPVTIAFFTWWFGASRAEKIKENNANTASLSYLKSLSHYGIVNLMTLHTAITMRLDICERYDKATENEKYILFSKIVFQDVYSQIEVEKYATFTLQQPFFTFNILQVKRSLVDIFETINLINMSISEIKDVEDISSQIIAFKTNLPCLLEKITFSIKKLLNLIHNIEYVTQKLKLSNVLKINFSEEEQNQLVTIIKDFHNP